MNEVNKNLYKKNSVDPKNIFYISLSVALTLMLLSTVLTGIDVGQGSDKRLSFMGLQFGSELKQNRNEMYKAYPDMERFLPNLSKTPETVRGEDYLKWGAKKTMMGEAQASELYLFFSKSNNSKGYIFTDVEIVFNPEDFEYFVDMMISKYGEPTKITSRENESTTTKTVTSPLSQNLIWNLKDINLRVEAEEYNSLDYFNGWESNINIRILQESEENPF